MARKDEKKPSAPAGRAPVQPVSVKLDASAAQVGTMETVAIKGTLYVQPNGDQFFEAAENSPKSVKKSNGYKLIYSNGITKHYTTRRRHVFFTSFSIDVASPIGAVLPREIVRFCAEASIKQIKYYTKKY